MIRSILFICDGAIVIVQNIKMNLIFPFILVILKILFVYPFRCWLSRKVLLVAFVPAVGLVIVVGKDNSKDVA